MSTYSTALSSFYYTLVRAPVLMIKGFALEPVDTEL